MSTQYIAVKADTIGELEGKLNEGFACGYQVVGGITPVYSPGLKLHGYVVLMEKFEEP